jgi:hypothetical protein
VSAADCKRCRERGKTWEGANPKCAFPSGVFRSDNWNCATMNELRELADSAAAWSEDQHAALLPWEGEFIVLGWYKHRGRTEVARVISTSATLRTLTLRKAEAFLAWSEDMGARKAVAS